MKKLFLLINYFLEKTYFRYLLVALAAYFIDFVGFIIILYLFEISPVIANIVIKVFASLTGYFLHKKFTYKLSKMHMTGSFLWFGSAFIYTPLSSILLSILLLYIQNPIIAKFISDILMYFLSYIYNTKIIFKE